MKKMYRIVLAIMFVIVCNVGVSAKEYVAFGLYPQTEVRETADLKTAAYDAAGDTEINGVKYRRLNTDEGNRYFVFEPILWEQHGDEYITKYVLDCQMYDAQEKKYKYGLGKTITIRMTFSDNERTLTKEEVMAVVDGIITDLEKQGIGAKNK